MAITILIVDDEPYIRRALKLTLHGEGYEIMEACNGQEALQLLEAQYASGKTVQLVLSDRDMPIMSGEELLCAIEQRYPEMIRMMVSGNIAAARRILAEHLVHDVVNKPWNDDQLRERVRRATGEQAIVPEGGEKT